MVDPIPESMPPDFWGACIGAGVELEARWAGARLGGARLRLALGLDLRPPRCELRIENVSW
jgi:hypothetical protein